jgi:hypothetical protein
VAEAEVAGGSPRKKPHGQSPRKKPRSEKPFLFRLNREKAATERGRKEPIGLEDPQGDPQGNPDDRTEAGRFSEGGRPKKAPPKTTKPPPVTQEDDGVGNLDSEEEEFDEDDNDDDGLKSRSVANDWTDGGRPKEDDDDELDAARDEATRASVPPRGHPPSNVVRPDKPYDVAARALSALRDDEPYRNPRFVQDHGMESGEEANFKANPPSVDGGVWVNDDTRGGQSRGQPPPQSTVVFGSTTGSKNQGKTPPGTPVQKRGRGPWCADPGTSDL